MEYPYAYAGPPPPGPPPSRRQAPPDLSMDPLTYVREHSYKTYRITHALHKRNVRRISQIETMFAERSKRLDTLQSQLEIKIDRQLQIATRENEKKLRDRLEKNEINRIAITNIVNGLTQRVERLQKEVDKQGAVLEQLKKRSSTDAKLQGDVDSLNKKYTEDHIKLDKEIQEVKRLLQHQNQNQKSDSLAATDQEDTAASSHRYIRRRTVRNKPLNQSTTDSEEYIKDSEALNQLLQTLERPSPPNEQFKFEKFVKQLRKMISQTPFPGLKLRALRHASEMCTGQAADWWEDVEEAIMKEMAEQEDEQQSTAGADLEDAVDEEDNSGDDREVAGQTVGDGDTTASTIAAAATTADVNEPSKAQKGIGESSQEGSTETEKWQLMSPPASPETSVGAKSTIELESQPQSSTSASASPPAKANLEKILSKIGTFSGLNFDRWSRRIQVAWDTNHNEMYRRELLKALPSLLQGEPARIVSSDRQRFDSMESWEQWKMALFLNLKAD
ncbi:unnamed protein product [Sympodiomycopsis kandeliae]